jgi:predicted nucleotidyltransferase
MRASDIKNIVRALNDVGVHFLIVGGYAVVAHGYGRFTADLDIICEFEPQNLNKAFQTLKELGFSPRVPVTAEQFADPACRKNWIESKGMQVLNFFHPQISSACVDLFVKDPFSSFQEAYEQALIEKSSDGTLFRFVDLDRLIEMKKTAGRNKDLIDLEYLTKFRDE